MKPIRRFTVVPSFPESLKPLHELALNLWWCWDHEAITLFHHLDSELWEAAYHNPVVMLGIISQERLEAAAQDEAISRRQTNKNNRIKVRIGEQRVCKHKFTLSLSTKKTTKCRESMFAKTRG